MSKKSICGIYKITSPSGKVYVGQSNDIHRRWIFYKNLLCKGQTKLFASLNKHGIENHLFEIIEECDVSGLNEKEVFYINKFNSFNSKHGMNLRMGGDCSLMSDETKKKISESHKGKTSHNKGKSMSQAQKDKISLANKGRVITLEMRRKISESLKGNVISEETRAKISATSKGRILGRLRTPEENLAHSLKLKGRPAPNKGLVMSETSRIRMKIGSHLQGRKDISYEEKLKARSKLREEYRKLGYDV